MHPGGVLPQTLRVSPGSWTPGRSHRRRRKMSPPWHLCFFPAAAERLPAIAEPLRTGRETNASRLLLRHLILPKGFVVERRFVDGHAAHVDLFQIRRPKSHGLGQKHHIVGVLERLIAGM